MSYLNRNFDEKMLAEFDRTLSQILPLRAPSRKLKANRSFEYVKARLAQMNRPFTQDKWGNLIVLPLWPEESEWRAIVCHTDAVDQMRGRDSEPVRLKKGIWSSVRGKRPMGADDKVGIAIALTILAHAPYLGALFCADEEVGGDGVEELGRDKNFPAFDLLIENDRRGGTDLITEIGGEIASPQAEKNALALCPHRNSNYGAFTDVDILAWMGKAKNAFNLSCGYYDPHTPKETVNAQEARQSLRDTWTLMHGLPFGMDEALYETGRFTAMKSYKDNRYADWTTVKSGGDHPLYGDAWEPMCELFKSEWIYSMSLEDTERFSSSFGLTVDDLFDAYEEWEAQATDDFWDDAWEKDCNLTSSQTCDTIESVKQSLKTDETEKGTPTHD